MSPYEAWLRLCWWVRFNPATTDALNAASRYGLELLSRVRPEHQVRPRAMVAGACS